MIKKGGLKIIGTAIEHCRHKSLSLWTWRNMVDKFHFLNTLPFLDKDNDNLILLSPSFFLLVLFLLALKHVDVSELLTVNYIVQSSPPLAWIHLSLLDVFIDVCLKP